MSLDAKQHWINLRITAVLNIPLCLWFIYSIVHLAGADYAQFTGWLQQPLNAGLLILFIISVFYHAALGVHEIIEDYVAEEKTRKPMLRIKALAFLALGVICIISILKVALT